MQKPLAVMHKVEQTTTGLNYLFDSTMWFCKSTIMDLSSYISQNYHPFSLGTN